MSIDRNSKSLSNYDFNFLPNFSSTFDLNSLFNFNFGSMFDPFSHKKTPTTTTTGSDVNLGAGLSYTIKTNGLSVHGNKGFEKVTVAQNISGIKIDSAVESVTLKGVKFDPSMLASSKGSLDINSAAGKLATLSVTANHDTALSFANAVGTVSLDNSGNGVFNLSELRLDKNQSFTATTDELQIYGSSGQEKVTLAHNVTRVGISSTVETVVMDGNSTNYDYFVDGGTVFISNKTTGDDVAFIDVNTATTGTKIQFADKTLTATWEITDSFGGFGGWGGWNSWGVMVTDPTTPAAPTTISGGTNLPYVVDFSQANFGSNLADVEATVKTALDNIGQYVSSKTPFNLQVLTERTSPETLAEANSTMISTAGKGGATQTTTFVADATSGISSNGQEPDATLYINLTNLSQMSFSGTPTADKYDLTTIVTHEILHGMAFTGNLEKGRVETPYDALVSTQNDSIVFTGSHAKAANGNNFVPLAPADAGDGSAYYHVAVASDLMSDSLGKGEVRTISPLDVAMLQDIGLTVIGVPPVQVA